MPSILDPARRRPPRQAKATRVEPLVGEIAEVLLRLGGSAHRDKVFEILAAHRTGVGEAGPAEPGLALRARAVAAFDAHSSADGRGPGPLFRKPFGPGAHRWALTVEAEVFLRSGGLPGLKHDCRASA